METVASDEGEKRGQESGAIRPGPDRKEMTELPDLENEEDETEKAGDHKRQLRDNDRLVLCRQ